MSELNIDKAIVSIRKAKGITQEELAQFMGVSKASVSKWETGKSYPDIASLPKLAAYLNLSIDELIGYEPQMSKEEISRTYNRLSSDFTTRPFDDVLAECRDIIQKYYACFPLLMKMGSLLIYNSHLAKDPKRIKSITIEATKLFIRAKNESANVEIIKKAQYMEAYCLLEMEDSKSAIELLELINEPQMNTGAGLAIAYHLEGRAEDVNIALQSGIYQYVFRLFELFQLYLLYSADDPGRYEKTLNRAFALADLFNIKNICPFMMIGLYYTAARKSLNQGDIEQVIIMLEHFSGLISEKPDQLKPGGDDFFNAIDNWLSDAELGAEVIQNEKTYKQRMLDAILNDTELLSVSQDPGIRSIIKKMTTLKERLNEKNTKNNS